MSSLTPEHQQFLREVARQAVSAAANGQAPVDVQALADEAGLTLEGTLMEKRGVFVTLMADKRLRGCIGFIEGFKPLVVAVAENGHNSAVGDPRFHPLQGHEVSNLDMELSVLTPLKEVMSHQDIQVGKHGILLEKNGRQAVFLPQVATEQGWDLDTTLTQLALKAGLGPQEWQQGANFKVFEAQIF